MLPYETELVKALRSAASYGLDLDNIEFFSSVGSDGRVHSYFEGCLSGGGLQLILASSFINMPVCPLCTGSYLDGHSNKVRLMYGSKEFKLILALMSEVFHYSDPSTSLIPLKHFRDMCLAKEEVDKKLHDFSRIDVTELKLSINRIFEEALIAWKGKLESDKTFKAIESSRLAKFGRKCKLPKILNGIIRVEELSLGRTREKIRESGLWVLTDTIFDFDEACLFRSLYPSRVSKNGLYNIPLYLAGPLAEGSYVQTDGPLSAEVFEIITSLTNDKPRSLAEALALAESV